MGRAAESFRADLNPGIDTGLARWFADRGMTFHRIETPRLRHLNPTTARLTLSTQATAATNRVQQLHQIGLVAQSDLLDATRELPSATPPPA